MGVYQKMKAAIYDLTEALDEAVAFNAAVPAMAGGPSVGRTNIRFANSVAGEQAKKYPGEARRYAAPVAESRFSLFEVS